MSKNILYGFELYDDLYIDILLHNKMKNISLYNLFYNEKNYKPLKYKKNKIVPINDVFEKDINNIKNNYSNLFYKYILYNPRLSQILFFTTYEKSFNKIKIYEYREYIINILHYFINNIIQSETSMSITLINDKTHPQASFLEYQDNYIFKETIKNIINLNKNKMYDYILLYNNHDINKIMFMELLTKNYFINCYNYYNLSYILLFLTAKIYCFEKGNYNNKLKLIINVINNIIEKEKYNILLSENIFTELKIYLSFLPIELIDIIITNINQIFYLPYSTDIYKLEYFDFSDIGINIDKYKICFDTNDKILLLKYVVFLRDTNDKEKYNSDYAQILIGKIEHIIYNLCIEMVLRKNTNLKYFHNYVEINILLFIIKFLVKTYESSFFYNRIVNLLIDDNKDFNKDIYEYNNYIPCSIIKKLFPSFYKKIFYLLILKNKTEILNLLLMRDINMFGPHNIFYGILYDNNNYKNNKFLSEYYIKNSVKILLFIIKNIDELTSATISKLLFILFFRTEKIYSIETNNNILFHLVKNKCSYYFMKLLEYKKILKIINDNKYNVKKYFYYFIFSYMLKENIELIDNVNYDKKILYKILFNSKKHINFDYNDGFIKDVCDYDSIEIFYEVDHKFFKEIRKKINNDLFIMFLIFYIKFVDSIEIFEYIEKPIYVFGNFDEKYKKNFIAFIISEYLLKFKTGYKLKTLNNFYTNDFILKNADYINSKKYIKCFNIFLRCFGLKDEVIIIK